MSSLWQRSPKRSRYARSAASSSGDRRRASAASSRTRRAGSALTMPPSAHKRSLCSALVPHHAADARAQQPVQDHRKEIVDQRCFPMLEQIALEPGTPRRARRADASGATGSASAASIVRWKRTTSSSQQHVPVEQRRDGARGRDGAGARSELARALAREPLAHAHHLLHEGPVEAKAGNDREQPVPHEQVVVHPALDQTQHLPEVLVVLGDRARRIPSTRMNCRYAPAYAWRANENVSGDTMPP